MAAGIPSQGLPGGGLVQPPAYTPLGREASPQGPAARRSEGPAWGSSDLDRLVRVGDGKARRETQSKVSVVPHEASKAALVAQAISGHARSGLKELLKAPLTAVGWLIGKPCLAALRCAQASMGRRELAAEKTYQNATPQLDALRGVPTRSALGEQREAVMNKVIAHATSTGKIGEGKLSVAQLHELVTIGENLVTGVLQARPGMPPASPYLAKAAAWYLMACAAHQDLGRSDHSTSDMATAGSFVMKDPGNRLYDYLASVPTCSNRMSTHMADRSAQDTNHKICGLMPWNAPAQRGIEDYRSTLPGEGGTMLFDKLRGGELMVKFEKAGCPGYYQSGHAESRTDRVVRFFAAMGRNIEHVVNFDKTRDTRVATAAGQINRHEHTYKGVLKASVGDPFKALAQTAVAKGVIDADAKALGKHMKEFGLPFVTEAVMKIKQQAMATATARTDSPIVQSNADSVVRECDRLLATIQSEKARLGETSNDLGIERRGAEVHLRLVPAG